MNKYTILLSGEDSFKLHGIFDSLDKAARYGNENFSGDFLVLIIENKIKE